MENVGRGRQLRGKKEENSGHVIESIEERKMWGEEDDLEERKKKTVVI